MTVSHGKNMSQLKRDNVGTLMKLLLTGECSSRIELSNAMGLTKMSITKLAAELLDRGILKETFPQRIPGQGRNPIQLVPGNNAPLLIGLSIRRSDCTAVLTDLRLREIRREVQPLSSRLVPSRKKFYELCTDLLDRLLGDLPAERILGIGVSSFSAVDAANGIILSSPEFYALRELSIVEELTNRYQLPVFLDRQAHCGALAELYFGEGQPYSDFLYLTLSGQIDSALVLGNELQGSSLLSRGLGHTTIDWKGPLCRCGNRGCLELYASASAVEQLLTAQTELKKSFREFCEYAEASKLPETDAIFEEMTEQLAAACLTAVNLTGIQAILLGQEGALLPSRYRKRLEATLRSRLLFDLRVLPSAFGEQGAIPGSACLPLAQLFSGRLSL